MAKKKKTQQKLAKKIECLISEGQTVNALETVQQFKATITDFELLLVAGKSHYFQGNHEKAIGFLKQASSIHPEHPEVRQMLWSSYRDSRTHSDEMLQLTGTMIQGNPSELDLLMAFRTYQGICDWHKARVFQDRVIKSSIQGNIHPDMLPALLIESCGISNIDQATVRDLHFRFGNDLFASRKHNMPSGYPALKELNGRLKIAYISADFNFHPVGCFINHIIANHSRNQFEIFCYAHLVRQDEITDHIRHHVDHFVDITALSDTDLAIRIHGDAIQVAIDLGGLTTNTRIAALAHRPAPVQITYLGYPNTTGLSTIDYRITDHHADENNDEFYREKLLYMPQSFISYGFDTSGFRSDSAPSEINGYITFGSFNHVRKLNPEVIETWSEILKRVPDSRLILKAKDMSDAMIRENIIREFGQHGISEDRLHLQGFTERYDDNFKMYNEIDIALDTFPYNGTTTTCDALSIGVPVLTLVGNSHAQRVSYSILKNIGFEESIAFSREQYIEKAVQLSQSPASLSVLRRCLVTLFKHSILRNPSLFTRQMETLISDAWQEKTGLSLPAAVRTDSDETANHNSLPASNTSRKLHVGGRERNPEWEIFDALDSEVVDHVGNANDLSRFEDNTFDAIYSSHVLEHFSYQGELLQVLGEWRRVLKPGGIIYASVPNIDVLCELFLDRENLSLQDRFMVMRMMFGGQIDAYDFHKVGYNEEILANFLAQAGFETIRMVPGFELFNDTSNMKFSGKRISLNIIAENPGLKPDSNNC